EAIVAVLRRPIIRRDQLAAAIADLDPDRRLMQRFLLLARIQLLRQAVVDDDTFRCVRRDERRHRPFATLPAPVFDTGPRREQLYLTRYRARIELCHRGEIIQDPEAAAVGRKP